MFILPDSWFVLANADKATVKEIDQHLCKISCSGEIPDILVTWVCANCLPRRFENPRLRDKNGVQLRDPKTNKPLREVNENYAEEIAQDRVDALAMIQGWQTKAEAEASRLAPIKTAAVAAVVVEKP